MGGGEPMADWSTPDCNFFQFVRKSDPIILEDLKPACFPQRIPTIVVTCSDYLRRHEMVEHLGTMRGYRREEDPETHLLAWHGGPIRFYPRSRVNYDDDDKVFTRELIEAVELTGISDVNLLGHWPCKKCLRHKLTPKDAFDHLVRALALLKEVLPEIQFRTLFHADYREFQPNKMRSYRLDPMVYNNLPTT